MSEFHSRDSPETIDTVFHATAQAPYDCALRLHLKGRCLGTWLGAAGGVVGLSVVSARTMSADASFVSASLSSDQGDAARTRDIADAGVVNRAVSCWSLVRPAPPFASCQGRIGLRSAYDCLAGDCSPAVLPLRRSARPSSEGRRGNDPTGIAERSETRLRLEPLGRRQAPTLTCD